MKVTMEIKDILAPLDVELKKVAILGGNMAVVVVPYENMDMALRSKRETDTAMRYGDYLVIGVFGMGADDASTQFLSVPKGIAVFPKDGDDVQALFFEAVERLNLSRGNSPWVKSLWETIKETSVHEADADGEGRFLTSTFYQFYAFMAAHPDVLGQVVATMGKADRHWIEDLLPYGMVSSFCRTGDAPEGDLAALIESWNYNEKLERKREQARATLRKFRTIEHLFTLPSISREIIEMAGDPMVAASNMARIIEKDPVLTSRLLKVVNSAFYGFRRQIVSVEHAVVILGNDEVVNLAFSIAVHQIMDRIAPKQGVLLWEHSLMVAHLAQWLGPLLGCTCGNALYTLGLLHDFGKIIFLQRGYTPPGDLTEKSSLQDLASEERETGMSHAEVGAFIAERWNLPEDIVDGLLGHHLPSKAKDISRAVTVHLADIIAHTSCLDLGEANTAAVRFLTHDMTVHLSEEVVAKRHEYIRTRVKALLDM